MLNFKQFYKIFTRCFLVGFVVVGEAAFADIAQGDGDPDEIAPVVASVQEPVVAMEEQTVLEENVMSVEPEPVVIMEEQTVLKADEQGGTADEAVATVTADGDFLLPTYLVSGETTMTTDSTIQSDLTGALRSAGVEMPLVMPVATPIVAASVTSTTVTTSSVSEPVASVGVTSVLPTSQIQGDVVAPRVQTNVSSGGGERITDDLDVLLAQTGMNAESASSSVVVSRQSTMMSDQAGEQTKPLLIPLTSMGRTIVQADEPVVPVKARTVAPSEYADQILSSLTNGREVPFKMPHEMKITFYPDASAFSGQSLKWIKAFAKTALLDPRLIVEIRASYQNADLQKKRMALVVSALKSVGLSTHQIATVYVNRPENTMLLRAIPRPEEVESTVEKNVQKTSSSTRQVTKW